MAVIATLNHEHTVLRPTSDMNCFSNEKTGTDDLHQMTSLVISFSSGIV